MFHNSLVHGLAANHGRDRRILLLIEMVLRWAKMSRFRESAMLLRGHDVYGNFEDAPRPRRQVHRDGAREVACSTRAPSASSTTAATRRARRTEVFAPGDVSRLASQNLDRAACNNYHDAATPSSLATRLSLDRLRSTAVQTPRR
jgi:hypothetical protein